METPRAFRAETLLHGGDYNPEQWLDRPDILEKDLLLMRQARINTVTLGVFSWSLLEPREGEYSFDWLGEIIDRVHAAGISVILATPSGARPRWLAETYPEVLRVDAMRRRALFGARHNHCYTSPAYRCKTHDLDVRLAQRFASHPAVKLWHISNEFGGECHCPLCQQAFRAWLRTRYASIDALNRAWNTAFWSHTYASFDQIESPSPLGDSLVHGLNLDWKRFVSARTADFMRAEAAALREGGAVQPVTANLMHDYGGLDYDDLAAESDVISWDNYPTWGKDPAALTASDGAMQHDFMRSLKMRPFLMMESCPTATNWQSVSRLKRPGLARAQGLQAIAHGADGALYFQIRQSRGCSEKFHGAVIDHYGEADTRVFAEVCATGRALEALAEVCGTETRAEAAVLYDVQNRWAVEDAAGPRNGGLPYAEMALKSYRALCAQGFDVDIITETRDLSRYRVIAAPMLYLFRAGIAEKLRAFVAGGGQLFITLWSGIVDEHDLTFLGGTPAGLMDVLGLRETEIDGLYDGEENTLLLTPSAAALGVRLPSFAAGAQGGDAAPPCQAAAQSGAGAEGNADARRAENAAAPRAWRCDKLCALPRILPENGAQPLLVYGRDFYAGTPAAAFHAYGAGGAWYLAANAEQDCFDALLTAAARRAGLTPPVDTLPAGVALTSRENEKYRWYFAQNFSASPVPLTLPAGTLVYADGGWTQGAPLEVYGTAVVRCEKPAPAAQN